MSNDDELLRRFEQLSFHDEPPMPFAVEQDIARGRRRLRRHWLVWGAGVLGGTAVVAAATLINPFEGPFVESPLAGIDSGLPVAGPASTPTDDPSDEDPSGADSSGGPSGTNDGPGPDGPRSPNVPDEGIEFPKTRTLLLQKSIQHLDPDAVHLPDSSHSFNGGSGNAIAEVGTKLSWTIPGEEGAGMILPVVTSPGFQPDELNIAEEIGCSPLSACQQVDLPKGAGTAWVANPDQRVWGALYQRPDGSVVGLQVSDLFGNDTTTPVSDVDITREQALEFVTDDDLRVDPSEL